MAKKTSVEIVIPVYNEESALLANIPILHSYCRSNLQAYNWNIVVADNASIDRTPQVMSKFSEWQNVAYIRLPVKGRGRALRQAWLNSKADIVGYMDIDLSSNLDFFSSLLAALDSGYDIAIGSRRAKGANVVGRTAMRKLMSWGLNFLLQLLFSVSFKDAQCGFKAIRRKVFNALEPYIQNNSWFFDSELLIIGEKSGIKIAEIPINWHDDPGSTVRISKTVTEDLLGMWRLWRTKPWEKLATP